MIVKPVFRSSGIAKELYRRLMEHAKDLKVKEVYLLTESVAYYFRKLGFKIIDRKYVPKAIQNTRQFIELCPSTALTMFNKLN